jgi:uncharacterized protein YxeA
MKKVIASLIVLYLLALGALYIFSLPVSPEERVILQKILSDAESTNENPTR